MQHCQILDMYQSKEYEILLKFYILRELLLDGESQ